MKNSKKNISIIVILILIMTLLISCNKKSEKIKVIVPSGTPTIAIAGLLDNEEYEIEVVSGADLLTSAYASSSHDVIISPINLGAKNYLLNNFNYKIDSIITFGNTYIVSKKENTLNSMNDLNGKEILGFGNKSTPGLILSAALDYFNVTSTVTYQNSVSDVIPLFVSNKYAYALVAEPALTQLKVKFKLDLNILDLQKELKDKIEYVPQAAIFVNSKSDKQDEIDDFIIKVKNNINKLNTKTAEYVNEIFELNTVKNAETVVGKYFTSLTKEVLMQSIPNSNIDYKKASESKEILNNYFDILSKYYDAILNGKKPDDQFYN